ncbi:MAG: YibE/F family protein, partial [Anaerorhabdus sp.]
MKKIVNQMKENRIVIVIILLTFISTMLFNQFMVKKYSRVNNESIDFVSAEVIKISSSELEYDDNLGINLGSQTLQIRFLEGNHKGE